MKLWIELIVERSTWSRGLDMAKANAIEGTWWPARQTIRDETISQLILADGPTDNANTGSVDNFNTSYNENEANLMVSEHHPHGGGPDQQNKHKTYMRVPYVGLERGETKNGSQFWRTRLLWVKWIDTAAGGGTLDIHGPDITMYFFEKFEWGRPLSWINDDYLYVTELTQYQAKTDREYASWLNESHLTSDEDDPLRSTGTRRGRNPAGAQAAGVQAGRSTGTRRGRNRPHWGGPNPSQQSAMGTAAAAIFSPGKWDRISSKLEQERVAMSAIARGVISRTPPGVMGLGTSMADHVRNHLEKAGYSRDQIAWYFNPTVNPLTHSLGIESYMKAGDTGNNPGGTPQKINPPTPAVTKLVVRAPIGYTKPAGRGEDQRPHIAQVGSYLEEPDRHFFRQIPNQVSYQGLGSRWVEIPRKGDFPIVEWSEWTLMKIQFDFLIAHDMDGLFVDVSEDIDQLRRMAQRPLPVSVYGMDQLFSLQMKRAQETDKPMQFVIADFTVKSARRTILEGDKQITAAQCSMTLQEIPIEEMTIVEMGMPPMTGAAVPSPKNDEEVGSDPLFSALLPAPWVIDANLLQIDTNTVDDGIPSP
jgi:hypothetical protein